MLLVFVEVDYVSRDRGHVMQAGTRPPRSSAAGGSRPWLLPHMGGSPAALGGVARARDSAACCSTRPSPSCTSALTFSLQLSFAQLLVNATFSVARRICAVVMVIFRMPGRSEALAWCGADDHDAGEAPPPPPADPFPAECIDGVLTVGGERRYSDSLPL